MLTFRYNKTFRKSEKRPQATVSVYSQFPGLTLPAECKLGMTKEAWQAIEKLLYKDEKILLDSAWDIFTILRTISPHIWKISVESEDKFLEIEDIPNGQFVK